VRRHRFRPPQGNQQRAASPFRGPSGTRFRIAAIVDRTREEALKFAAGLKAYDLPEGFPRSVEVVVTNR
jgi:hypothetical protein